VTDIPSASPTRAINETLMQRMDNPDPEDTRAIIDRYKMKRIDARMPIRDYAAETFSRQRFIRTYASAQVSAANSQNSLGMLWVVLNPTLNAIIYWLIFGKVLGQDKSIANYIAFVVIGVFTMEFLAQALSSGTNAITGNLGLVRSLQFPRAVLPITMVYREFLEHLVALAVMFAVVIVSVELPDFNWFLFPLLVGLQILFCMSIAFVAARLGNAITDFKNFVPFIARVWLMLSGAVFSLQPYLQDPATPWWAKDLMVLNPAFSYLELSRSLLMDGYQILGPNGGDITLFCWISAVVWAIVPLPIAFMFFARGEHSYGKS